MIRKLLTSAALFFLISIVLVACSSPSTTKSTPSPAVNPSDLTGTLVFYTDTGASEQEFNQRIGDPVRKQFPNLTINYIQKGTNTTLPQLVASGQQIDVYWSGLGNTLADYNMQYDMTSLLGKHNVDLSRFEPTLIDAEKQLTGGMFGLPVWMDELVLFYNKDLFDKFAVPYPHNGMTWPQLLELAKQLTKQDGGKQYVGLSARPQHILRTNQYSLPYIDPKTGTAAINTNSKWKDLFQTAFVGPSIDEGYKAVMKQLSDSFPYRNSFFKDQNLAMLITVSNTYYSQPATTMNSVNWDMVSMPTLPDQPGVGAQAIPYYFSITSTSSYKDQAMEVLNYLASDAYQLEWARKLGTVPVLKNQSIKAALGQDSPFKGKNFSALYNDKLAPLSTPSKYDSAVEDIYAKAAVQVAEGSVDINTALRNAEDDANKAIAAAKQNQ